MNILNLTLKKKWFYLIFLGQKKIEYREIKSYWDKRLFSKRYTHIKFKNGYNKDAPEFLIELLSIKKGYTELPYALTPNKFCYCLHLGEIISSSNIINQKQNTLF
ncbi:MAG: ASCH domain-containing protein [Deltaproteobacteria bacterium]|nr:ASCH domain-containing protein [Deltaproteobacteria bacterium]